MKRSTKTLISIFVFIILVVTLLSLFFSNTTKTISTDEFFAKAGVIFVKPQENENTSSSESGSTSAQEDGSTSSSESESTSAQESGSSSVQGGGITSEVEKDSTSGKENKDDKDDKIQSFEINGTTIYYNAKPTSDEIEIKEIVISTYVLKGKNDKGKVIYEASYPRNEFYEQLIFKLKEVGCITSFDYKDPNAGSVWSTVIMPIGYGLIAVILIVMFIRQMRTANSGVDSYGKTKAKINTNVKVRFSDVAGAEEEKEELKEIVEFLKNPQKFAQVGARTPKGVLLVGNPGTGKTLFAKAVAGEANVPFFSISGSNFVEMFVGVGASRVRDLFATAKKNMPCIVFIDEIDAVGRQRGAGLGGGNDEREQTLNQLLVEMDGFESNDGIIIMAATNREDVLDPALLRPGRFDRRIYVNMPDVKGREAIIRVHARNKPLAKDVNFKTVAKLTAGFSGADIANLMNEAAILAARDSRKEITNVDLYEAINKVVMGPQKKSRVITEPTKRLTSYHESGHAILARLLPNCDPVQEVSIIPRGPAGGYTLILPDDESASYNKAHLLDDIVMTLGGRVAEEIIIKDISAGASSDISHVTKIARKMVTEWGMSDKIGPVNYGSDNQIFVGRDYQTKSDYSEEMAKTIDAEVERIIKEAHAKATTLLTENKAKLEVMARVLVEKETIYAEEVDMIMAGKSASEVIAYMESGVNSNEDPIQRMERTLDGNGAQA